MDFAPTSLAIGHMQCVPTIKKFAYLHLGEMPFAPTTTHSATSGLENPAPTSKNPWDVENKILF